MESLLSFQLDLTALKEPRGFIRIIQFVFAILAFATTSGFSTSGNVNVVCSDTSLSPKYTIEYPFSGSNRIQLTDACMASGQKDITPSFPLTGATSSEFFVAVGVLSMLYSLLAVGFYTLFAHVYAGNAKVPLIDLIVTGVLTFFWFVGWCAWVANVGNVTGYHEVIEEGLKKMLNSDALKNLDVTKGKFAKLTVSLIFGFGNIVLWGASCWFVFKETGFHKEPEQTASPTPAVSPHQQVPPRV